VRRPSRFSRFRGFRVSTFPCISRFRALRAFAHITHIALFAFSRISRFRAFRVFAHFAFSRISRFRAFRIFAHFASRAIRVSDSSHFRAFRVFRILAFFALRYALPRASLGSIAFRSHVLSSSSKVHWCVSHFVSLAFHHIYLCIPLYVHLSYQLFILHHLCTFSATYSAPRPGNSLSMLTRQHIVRGFYFTSLLSLRLLVSGT
jgi:hypothetical protein